MYCSKCGTKLEDGDLFCPHCGSPAPSNAPLPDSAPMPENTPLSANAPAPAISPLEQTAGAQAVRPPSPTMTAQRTALSGDQPPTVIFPDIQSATKKKRRHKPLIAVLSAVVGLLLLAGVGFGIHMFFQSSNYTNAEALASTAESSFQSATDQDGFRSAMDGFTQAEAAFEKLGHYRDSTDRALACQLRIGLAQQNIDYLDALDLFHNKEFKSALDAFTGLGSFKDSASMAQSCQQNIDFQGAQADFAAGDYNSALAVFSTLKDAGFSGAEDWWNKTSYALADALFQSGDLYGAWKAFTDLGSYEDSADRATACTTPFPGTGVLSQDAAYKSSAVRLDIDGASLSSPRYLKVYDANTNALAATVFVNPETQAVVNLPAGTYTIRSAAGDNWFGESIMFGDEGYYATLLFDGENTSTTLSYGYTYTLTLEATDEGNVGSEGVGREDF
ncbi:MAG: zinc-ribbon domain-containing protein [Coriobacteriia bacterium]|nr:zinc-ribbon domain-containing protein [Coriobacteriia bacterium]